MKGEIHPLLGMPTVPAKPYLIPKIQRAWWIGLKKVSCDQIGHTRLQGKSIRFVLWKALFSFAESGFCTLAQPTPKLQLLL
jgi:hypothetical protein